MEKLFQREDVRDSGKSSYDETSNNVIKSGKSTLRDQAQQEGEVVYKKSMKNIGYNTMREFDEVHLQEPLKDSYLTLWMHQVHTWFAADGNQTTSSKLKTFIADAKSSGFKQLMFDVPWSWTERDAQGDVQIDSFNKEDVMSTACELGLSLNIVITMRELPLWMNNETFLKKEVLVKDVKKNQKQVDPPLLQTLRCGKMLKNTWQLLQSYYFRSMVIALFLCLQLSTMSLRPDTLKNIRLCGTIPILALPLTMNGGIKRRCLLRTSRLILPQTFNAWVFVIQSPIWMYTIGLVLERNFFQTNTLNFARL